MPRKFDICLRKTQSPDTEEIQYNICGWQAVGNLNALNIQRFLTILHKLTCALIKKPHYQQKNTLYSFKYAFYIVSP